MDRIWAPWRMEYISNADHSDGCIFCAFPAESRDEDHYILHRGSRAFVMLNKYPYSNGHLMVAPFRHTADLNELESDEMLEVTRLIRTCVNTLKSACSPDGFNIGVNMGRVAGAGIADHIHAHVVPRWSGDTNFMAVMGDIRVVPEGLARTYARLREHLDV